jgi:hypothetical protein
MRIAQSVATIGFCDGEILPGAAANKFGIELTDYTARVSYS